MAIKVNAALDIINKLDLNLKFEIIPIEDSQNRVCAQDISATSSLPKFDNSAMDGYGIVYEEKNKEFEIIETIFAGDNKNITLQTAQAVKIMTGARIPSNCSAVIPKEECEHLNNGKIKVPNDIKKFQHIRFIGEDIKTKETLIIKGEEINFAKITLLASQGISHIKVYKKPKVVVFASGEELKLHFEHIEDYQIYNSNTPTFMSRCKELGAKVDFIGQAKDSIKSIEELIKNSLDADLIITSGGVSVGDADFTKDAFAKLDFETIFDGIMIKPGKPTILGRIDKTYILNLPGNPLASALIFELFGKIIVQKLIGSKNIHHNYIETKLKDELENKNGRITIIPGFFDGTSFELENKRSPGMVSTLSRCNSFLVLDENVSKIKKDSSIKILPINWKFFTDKKKDFLTYE